MKKYSPLQQEAHFCKSIRNHVQQKSNFSAWMCLRVPSCRIWAAKRISKKRWKYVYYFYMAPSCGPLWFFAASKPLHFHYLLFFASTLYLFFQLDLVSSFRFCRIMLPAAVGSIILEMGTHQLGPQKSHFWPSHAHYWVHVGPVLRFLPLHSRNARSQKTLEKCVLFLQFSFLRLLLKAFALTCLISS